MKYETIIGLEVHIQLATKSKLFSGSAAVYGDEPNSNANIIDLGFPGVLPVLNEKAIDYAIKFGLSINADIAKKSIFVRKNYFYPDLPKGYQITQNDFPIVKNGFLNLQLEDGITKKIRITKAHLEEDSGKMLHAGFHKMSAIDFNRAGIPLLEVVSEPDIRSAKEATLYLKTLRNLIRCLEISDGNMQEGSFRCDVNISVKPIGVNEPGTRSEIKNLNSFRFIEKAIAYEASRQITIIDSGGEIIQETRLYDTVRDETRPLRIKEEVFDYRYLPEPDLLPLLISEQKINEIRNSLPELPWHKLSRFCDQYELSVYDAGILTSSKELANYFEMTLKLSKAPIKLVANWVIVELLGMLNKSNKTISETPISSKQLAELVNRVYNNTISGKIAKKVFETICSGESNVDEIIEKQNLKQIKNNSEIEKIIDEIFSNNPKQVAAYLTGKEAIFTFFVGLVMKATQSKANPKLVNKLLNTKFKKLKS